VDDKLTDEQINMKSFDGNCHSYLVNLWRSMTGTHICSRVKRLVIELDSCMTHKNKHQVFKRQKGA
jgi:hypothetical protein